MFALLADSQVEDGLTRRLPTPMALLPVVCYYDADFAPDGVIVATQSCWLSEATASLEGGEDAQSLDDAIYNAPIPPWKVLIATTSTPALDAPDEYPTQDEVVLDALPSDHAIPFALTRLGEHASMTPLKDRAALLQAAHVSAHRGSRGTMQRLLADGHKWPSMEKDCLEAARSCRECQRYTTQRYGFHPLRLITADMPMDHLAIDLAHMPTSECGHNYILVIVDICTRFVWLYPLPSKTGPVVSARLRELFLLFGLPRVIQSDNGSEFVNLGLKVVLDGAGVDHRRVAPYRPQGNGAAERAVRSVKEVLLPLIRGDLGSWARRLPEAQYAMNTSVHRRHGSTPFSLMFARGHNPLRAEPIQPSRPLTEAEFQRRYEVMSEVVFPAIATRTNEYNKKVFKDFYKRHKMIAEDLPPGSMVMKQVKPFPRSGEPAWEGPFFVLQRNRGGSYVLRDATNALVPRPTPLSQLRLVSYEGALNPDSFEVDHVIGHRDLENGARQFLFRWKDQESKSWVDEKDIDTLKCITDY